MAGLTLGSTGSGMEPTCTPNALIMHVHNGLPKLFNSRDLGLNASLDEVASDILRAGGWAGLIVLFAIFLMICNCVCCCFICGLCCSKERKPPAVKLGIGAVTFLLVVVSIIFVLTGFGIEVAIHKTIIDTTTSVLNFVGNNSDENTDAIRSLVNVFEKQRHQGVLSCLGILLFKLLIPLVWITLGPFCGTPVAPVVIFVDLVVTGVVTLVTSIGIAMVFAELVIYADTCVILYDIVPNVCIDPAFLSANIALEGFCNTTLTYGFSLFFIGVVLILLLLLVMLFGAIYGASLTGKRVVEISVSADEVWTAEDPVRGTQINYNSEDEVPLMGPVADN